jgi:hypothetical protein
MRTGWPVCVDRAAKSGPWTEPSCCLQDALGWVRQSKRLHRRTLSQKPSCCSQDRAGVGAHRAAVAGGSGLRIARAVLLPVVLVGGPPFTSAIAADFAILGVVGELLRAARGAALILAGLAGTDRLGGMESRWLEWLRAVAAWPRRAAHSLSSADADLESAVESLPRPRRWLQDPTTSPDVVLSFYPGADTVDRKSSTSPVTKPQIIRKISSFHRNRRSVRRETGVLRIDHEPAANRRTTTATCSIRPHQISAFRVFPLYLEPQPL